MSAPSPTAQNLVPTDDQLAASLRSLRTLNPVSGASKLHALLLSENSTWTVSEKRVRKVLQREGLALGAPSDVKDLPRNEFPVSQLNNKLNVKKWSNKIEVKYFGKERGKGLVAIEEIHEGEIVWKEDPVVMCPEWELQELQMTSNLCARCTQPSPSMPCPSGPPCRAEYCNRLCLTRSASQHTFLCPTQNPASVALLELVRKEKWKALGAWVEIIALVLGQWSKRKTEEMEETLELLRGLAGMSLAERVKILPGWQANQAESEQLWRRCHQQILDAFSTPSNPAHAKKLAKLYGNGKRPLPEDLHEEILGWDGFLLGLGKMSLNFESHGGIYALHSHLNHSCLPNTSVRHLDRFQIPRINIIARQDIYKGEEVVISYVDPALDVKTRRRELREWGWGECMCQRCVEEAAKQSNGEEAKAAEDLEDELRGFLGV